MLLGLKSSWGYDERTLGEGGEKNFLLDLPGQVANGGEGQGAPVVALQVLLDNVGRLGVAEHPIFAPETVVLINNVI